MHKPLTQFLRYTGNSQRLQLYPINYIHTQVLAAIFPVNHNSTTSSGIPSVLLLNISALSTESLQPKGKNQNTIQVCKPYYKTNCVTQTIGHQYIISTQLDFRKLFKQYKHSAVPETAKTASDTLWNVQNNNL